MDPTAPCGYDDKRMKKFLGILACFLFLGAVTGAAFYYPSGWSSRGKADEGLVLAYDDRYTFDQEIKEIRMEEITSFRTGTDIPDEKILEFEDGDRIHARAAGCGNAEVELADGTVLKVSVRPAPISLLLLAGQSNCEGCANDKNALDQYKKEWILNPEGSVYSSYGVTEEMFEQVAWYDDRENLDHMTLHNYRRFLPSSLTDNSRNDVYNRTDSLTNARGACGKGGIDSALAYRWRQLTGEKVWIVNASRHGHGISFWDPEEKEEPALFQKAVRLYKGAERILGKEIAAGHYQLSHKGIYWCHGETDSFLKTFSSQYQASFDQIRREFRRQLSGKGIENMEKDIEFFGIIMPRGSLFHPNKGADYALTGARMAQYYMVISQDYPDVYMATYLGDLWTDDQTVEAYFTEKYGTEKNFNALWPMHSRKVALPTTLDEVHGSIHYTQIGYNELGFDAAENICYALGYCRPERQKVKSVSFITADGTRVRNGETVAMQEKIRNVLAIRVSPAYMTKAVEVNTSDNMIFNETGVRMLYGEEGTVKVRQGSLKEGITFKRDEPVQNEEIEAGLDMDKGETEQ